MVPTPFQIVVPTKLAPVGQEHLHQHCRISMYWNVPLRVVVHNFVENTGRVTSQDIPGLGMLVEEGYTHAKVAATRSSNDKMPGLSITVANTQTCRLFLLFPARETEPPLRDGSLGIRLSTSHTEMNVEKHWAVQPRLPHVF